MHLSPEVFMAELQKSGDNPHPDGIADYKSAWGSSRISTSNVGASGQLGLLIPTGLHPQLR